MAAWSSATRPTGPASRPWPTPQRPPRPPRPRRSSSRTHAPGGFGPPLFPPHPETVRHECSDHRSDGGQWGADGLVYALIAYGFQLTYATSKSINFGQGELVMVSAFFSLTLTNLGLPYWAMVPGGLLFGALLGLVVELSLIHI